jgi:hypothetical protein
MTTWEDANGSRLVELLVTDLERVILGVHVGETFEVPSPSGLCSCLEVLRSATSLSVAVPRLLLGEPGAGQLGISGPPCNSSAAGRLFSSLLR